MAMPDEEKDIATATQEPQVAPIAPEPEAVSEIDIFSDMGLATPEEEKARAEKQKMAPTTEEKSEAQTESTKEPEKAKPEEAKPETPTPEDEFTKLLKERAVQDGMISVVDEQGNIVGIMPLHGKITLKVDGQEIPYSVENLIRQGQKLLKADKVLQDAVEIKRKEEEARKKYDEAVNLVISIPDSGVDELLTAAREFLNLDADAPIEAVKAAFNVEKFREFMVKRDAALVARLNDLQSSSVAQLETLNQRFTQMAMEKAKSQAPLFSTLLGEKNAVGLILGSAFGALYEEGLLYDDKGKPRELADEVLTQHLESISQAFEKKLTSMIEESYKKALDREIEALRKDPDFRKQVAEEYLKEQGKLESIKTGSVSGETPKPTEDIDSLMEGLGYRL